jgi:hypothetical protein
MQESDVTNLTPKRTTGVHCDLAAIIDVYRAGMMSREEATALCPEFDAAVPETALRDGQRLRGRKKRVQKRQEKRASNGKEKEPQTAEAGRIPGRTPSPGLEHIAPPPPPAPVPVAAREGANNATPAARRFLEVPPLPKAAIALLEELVPEFEIRPTAKPSCHSHPIAAAARRGSLAAILEQLQRKGLRKIGLVGAKPSHIPFQVRGLELWHYNVHFAPGDDTRYAPSLNSCTCPLMACACFTPDAILLCDRIYFLTPPYIHALCGVTRVFSYHHVYPQTRGCFYDPGTVGSWRNGPEFRYRRTSRGTVIINECHGRHNDYEQSPADWLTHRPQEMPQGNLTWTNLRSGAHTETIEFHHTQETATTPQVTAELPLHGDYYGTVNIDRATRSAGQDCLIGRTYSAGRFLIILKSDRDIYVSKDLVAQASAWWQKQKNISTELIRECTIFIGGRLLSMRMTQSDKADQLSLVVALGLAHALEARKMALPVYRAVEGAASSTFDPLNTPIHKQLPRGPFRKCLKRIARVLSQIWRGFKFILRGLGAALRILAPWTGKETRVAANAAADMFMTLEHADAGLIVMLLRCLTILHEYCSTKLSLLIDALRRRFDRGSYVYRGSSYCCQEAGHPADHSKLDPKATFIPMEPIPEECATTHGPSLAGIGFEGAEPLIVRRCIHNEEKAIIERAIAIRPPPIPGGWLTAHGIMTNWGRMIYPVEPTPFKEWASRYPLSKREALRKARDAVSTGYDPQHAAHKTLFVKIENSVEELSEDGTLNKAPRAIQATSMEELVTLGPTAHALSKSCKGYALGFLYAPGCNAEDLDSWHSLARATFQDPVAISLDSVRLDASQKREAHSAYLSFCTNAGTPELYLSQLKASQHVKGSTRSGLKYRADYTIGSGVPITTQMNTITTAAAVRSAVQDPSKAKFAAAGDDVYLMCERTDAHDILPAIVRQYEAMGYQAKASISELEFGEFCSGRFWLHSDGHYRFAPKPGKLLTKLFYAPDPRVYRGRPLEYISQVAEGMFTTAGHMPIVREILLKIVSLAGGTAVATVDAHRILRASGLPYDDTLYEQYRLLYGLTRDDFRSLLVEISFVDELPYLVKSQAMVQMARVDTSGQPPSWLQHASLLGTSLYAHVTNLVRWGCLKWHRASDEILLRIFRTWRRTDPSSYTEGEFGADTQHSNSYTRTRDLLLTLLQSEFCSSVLVAPFVEEVLRFTVDGSTHIPFVTLAAIVVERAAYGRFGSNTLVHVVNYGLTFLGPLGFIPAWSIHAAHNLLVWAAGMSKISNKFYDPRDNDSFLDTFQYANTQAINRLSPSTTVCESRSNNTGAGVAQSSPRPLPRLGHVLHRLSGHQRGPITRPGSQEDGLSGVPFRHLRELGRSRDHVARHQRRDWRSGPYRPRSEHVNATEPDVQEWDPDYRGSFSVGLDSLGGRRGPELGDRQHQYLSHSPDQPGRFISEGHISGDSHGLRDHQHDLGALQTGPGNFLPQPSPPTELQFLGPGDPFQCHATCSYPFGYCFGGADHRTTRQCGCRSPTCRITAMGSQRRCLFGVNPQQHGDPTVWRGFSTPHVSCGGRRCGTGFPGFYPLARELGGFQPTLDCSPRDVHSPFQPEWGLFHGALATDHTQLDCGLVHRTLPIFRGHRPLCPSQACTHTGREGSAGLWGCDHISPTWGDRFGERPRRLVCFCGEQSCRFCQSCSGADTGGGTCCRRCQDGLEPLGSTDGVIQFNRADRSDERVVWSTNLTPPSTSQDALSENTSAQEGTVDCGPDATGHIGGEGGDQGAQTSPVGTGRPTTPTWEEVGSPWGDLLDLPSFYGELAESPHWQ